MNGELTKHMVKRPFYSVDYFFMDDVYADAPVVYEDLEEIFKYTNQVQIETYMQDHTVDSVEQYGGLIKYLKHEYPSTNMVIETIRFRLNETNTTWFDLSHKSRVVKEELPA